RSAAFDNIHTASFLFDSRCSRCSDASGTTIPFSLAWLKDGDHGRVLGMYSKAQGRALRVFASSSKPRTTKFLDETTASKQKALESDGREGNSYAVQLVRPLVHPSKDSANWETQRLME